MNLHHLELFYYVAKHGGISRAVRHIPYGIQQPAVSSQIGQLEQDLGTKLFERQPFRLTAPGQELYEFARPFFDHVQTVANRLRQHQAPRLRIAASELILRNYFPAVLERLREQHPDLRLALRTAVQSQVETWLHEGQIDVAICPFEDRPAAGLKCLPIASFPPVLLVPRESPIIEAKQLWAQNPIAEPLISLPPTETITRMFQKGLRQMRMEWPTAIEASSTEVVTQYVASGYGLGVGLNVSDYIQNPKVRVVPLPGFEPVEIVAVWRPPVSANVKSLLAAVETRAAELWGSTRT